MTTRTSGDLGPLPDPQRWQEQVLEALAEADAGRRQLRWERADEYDRWDLTGDCPRCGDVTSKLVGGVVVAESALEAGDLVELMMTCACAVEHQSGSRGCGAGRGFYIKVPGPGGSA